MPPPPLHAAAALLSIRDGEQMKVTFKVDGLEYDRRTGK
jgi:hypothetical protein